MTPDPEELLARNRAWARRMEDEHPGFFAGLAHQQRPRYLWIGCSDSRVPANQITDLRPGEVFVHRNVANVFHPEDPNAMAALEFAVGVLEVEHVIVCGHYGCGGVLAALEDAATGTVRSWIEPIRVLAEGHREELDALASTGDRARRLCELNVLEQARRVLSTDVIRNRRAAGAGPSVHAWIYDVGDGLLRQLDES